MKKCIWCPGRGYATSTIPTFADKPVYFNTAEIYAIISKLAELGIDYAVRDS